DSHFWWERSVPPTAYCCLFPLRGPNPALSSSPPTSRRIFPVAVAAALTPLHRCAHPVDKLALDALSENAEVYLQKLEPWIMFLLDLMAFREQALRLILDLSSTVITLLKHGLWNRLKEEMREGVQRELDEERERNWKVGRRLEGEEKAARGSLSALIPR
ncbi:hypothetical protein Taro_036032, partial [Colocasia esculenta]|nr:hypothetical protein [Colocasia esculenta]